MAGVGRGEPFTQENMAKMAATVSALAMALDLDSHTVGVGLNHMPSGRFAANGAWVG